MTIANTLDDLERYYSIHPSGCWNWHGSRCTNGYGQMHINGKLIMAHRASWTKYKGNIPDNLCVLHTCDNRTCINPDHLFLGTYADNACDRETKNRGANRVGKMNGRAKLNDNLVKEIKHELSKDKTCADLAYKYNVSWSTIKLIKEGKIWRHVQ